MLNGITAAIAVKLNSVFGDGFKIYKNDVRQGMKKPCFFITVAKPALKPLPGRRYLSTNPFDIIYFPEKDGDNGEILDIAGQLPRALETIKLPCGDLVRGGCMSFELGTGKEEGTMRFHVEYNIFLLVNEAAEMMEELTVIQA